MDDIDRLLARLQDDPVPDGLAGRVARRFHQRHRRRQAAQYISSAIMMLAGAWLFVPWLVSIGGQVSLPQNGLPVLQSMFSLTDPGFAADTTYRSVSYLQTSLSSQVAPLHWIGFLALALGALIGLSSLLPSLRVE